MDKCVSCRFYDRGNSTAGEANGPQWGQCRRTAPMLHPVNVKAYMIEGVWPHVRDDDWCGEWSTNARPARSDAAAAQAATAGARVVTPAAAAAPAAARPAPTAPARPSMLTPLPAGAAAPFSANALAGMAPRGNSD